MASTIGYIKYATKDILNRYNNLLGRCFNSDGSFNQEAYEHEHVHCKYMSLMGELVALLVDAGTNVYAVALVRGTTSFVQDSFTTVIDSQLTLINSK